MRPGPDHVLTSRQRKVLNVIKDSVQKRGYPPSMREIGEAVGLASTSSVASQLSALQRKGYLYRDVGRPRAVEVRLPGLQARPEPGREEDEAAGIPDIDIPSQEAGYAPVVGRITPGGPILPDQHMKDVFRLPRELVGEDDPLVVLKVVGDSMIGAAIADGDWVVVRPQPPARDDDLRDGELVAADIDGAVMVRTCKQIDGHVWLIPHHPTYTPTTGDKASILGRVVTVLRAV